MSDHDGFVVHWIVDVWQSGVAAGRGLIDLCGTFHVQSFVGTLVVEDLDKFVKGRLLLKKIDAGGFGRFFFQGEMHAFMPAVLLRMIGLMRSMVMPRRTGVV
jgi:hypothetical protein